MMIKQLLVNTSCIAICVLLIMLLHNGSILSSDQVVSKPSHRGRHERRNNEEPDREFPLLTLFTTFKDEPDRMYIQRNTILNWALFGQDLVRTVMFSNKTSGLLEDTASSSGWQILPQQRVNEAGTPFLKDMIYAVRQRHKSTFYAFVNGDIMFHQSLIDTLKSVERKIGELNATLIVGMRTDYKVNYSDPHPLYSHENVTTMAGQGKLFRPDAQDYFIATRNFPWMQLKDIVVGRPGCDNYIVGSAINMGLSVIDATKTLTALHQNAKVYPYAGAQNPDGGFNRQVIGNFDWNTGLTSSCKLEAVRDFSGEVYIRKR